MIQNPEDSLANDIRIFLESYGIEPIYTGTVIVLLIVWSYRKDFENWEKLEGWQKGIIGSPVLGAIVFSIISFF